MKRPKVGVRTPIHPIETNTLLSGWSVVMCGWGDGKNVAPKRLTFYFGQLSAVAAQSTVWAECKAVQSHYLGADDQR